MGNAFTSILASLVGIVISGVAGGLAGWSVVAMLGVAALPGALIAAAVGMVVATVVFLGLTVVLRRLGLVR